MSNIRTDTNVVKVTEQQGNVVKVTEQQGNVVKLTEQQGNVVKLTEQQGNVVKLTEQQGNVVKVTEQRDIINVRSYGTPVYVENVSASYVPFSGVDGLTELSSSVTDRITNLEYFSSSLDNTFATDLELTDLSSSLNEYINETSQSLYEFQQIYNTGSFTGSFTGDGGGLYNIPAAGIVGLNLSQIQSGSVSASIAPNRGFRVNTDSVFQGNITANSFTGSSALISGDMVVGGKLTAQEFHTEYVSSSIIYKSGSTKFGDSSDDIHQFTGSLRVSGSGTHWIIGGNVGINKRNPQYDLDVLGSGNFTNTLHVTGGLLVTQSFISTIDYIDYRQTTDPAFQTGRTHWVDDTKTINIDTDVNNFSIEVGHQNVVRVRNTNNFLVQKGTVVYINGESGNRPNIAIADWTNDANSASTIGLVAQDIPKNQTGYVVTNGLLRGIDTNAYAPGTQLYLSSSGHYTAVIPQSPLHEVRLAKTVTQANNGILYVDVMNGYELGELHDVLITNRQNGDLITWNNSSKVFENTKTLSGSYAVTDALTVGSVQFRYSSNLDVDTGVETIMTIATGSYRCAFFDYVVTKTTNARSGTVYAVWNGSTIEFTETSTNDIGATSDLTLTPVITGANVSLRATAISDNWSVKLSVRML